MRSPVAGWLLAASVYFLAVLHRTSLGVAGLVAERRYDISPAQLSVFVFLQIGVYAAMQVPTGILVDRHGPRRLLVVASALMGSAQLVFALVPSFPVALLARALLGCGDALTFVSVLRFAATHFSPRRYPVVVAATATIGSLGNVLATLPLALALKDVGWAPAFATTASVSLVAAAAVWRLLPDSTPPPKAIRNLAALRVSAGGVWTRVRTAWALPGTRLGFWVHFASMSTATTLAVLWGSPYLQAVGLSASGAGGVLMGGVILASFAAPALGWLTGRHPAARVPISLGCCTLTVLAFTVLVTAFGDRPPHGYVVPLFVLMALGGPASMVAFALARDYNRASTLGTASGVVNVGGFVATVLGALGIGWVLDAAGGARSAHAMHWALLVPICVQALATTRVLVWWLRVRRFVLTEQAHGRPVPVAAVRRRWDLPVR